MAPAEQFREFTVGGISGRSHLDEIRLDRGADRAGLRAKPGKYQGHFHDGEGERLEEFTFRVSRDGRKLKRFRALLGVICSYYPPTVEAHPFGYPTVRITRRHTFRKVWKPNEDSRILLRGRFKGNRLIKGKLDYTVGICVRVGYLKARRVGP
jgi:hypothetical protein